MVRETWDNRRTVLRKGTPRPATANELFATLSRDGGTFWHLAAGLYERASGRRPSETEIRAFVAECPPFQALMHALVHAHCEWATVERPVSKKKRVGRVDLFSSVCLPYCDLYLTNDVEQEKCLTQIAATVSLPVAVLSLADFGQEARKLDR
jgi:hypothetical protein